MRIHKDRFLLKSLIHLFVFMVLSRLFGAFKEVSIANSFGVNSLVDSYQFALSLTLWIPIAVQSVILTSLIPKFVSLDMRIDPQNHSYLSHALTVSIIFGAILAVISYVISPIILPMLFADDVLSRTNLVVMTTKKLFLVPFFIVVNALFFARLQSRRLNVPTLLEGVPYLVIAVFAWKNPMGVLESLVWGTNLGFGLQAVLGYIFVCITEAHIVKPANFRVGLLNENQSISFFLLLFGQIALGLTIPIDNYIATTLGEGVVSQLTYANRPLFLLLGAATVVVGRAILPSLSESILKNSVADVRKNVSFWLCGLFVGGLILTLLLLPTSSYIITILYQRGQFDGRQTMVVAELFQYGLMQVPFYYSGIVLVQYFAALGAMKLLAITCLANVAIKLSTVPILCGLFGVAGIQISNFVMYAFGLFFMFFNIRRAERALVT